MPVSLTWNRHDKSRIYGIYQDLPEAFMLNSETSSNKWKTEQLTYFREYIKSFKPGSAEYNRIAHDIRELENHN